MVYFKEILRYLPREAENKVKVKLPLRTRLDTVKIR
jgi:hypothetical protein